MEHRRLEAFSDGVFAIAITLLVLDIGVPKSEFDDLWHGIGSQWPSYLGYATSFLTIGGIWLMHHAIVRRIDRADSTVMRINLLLLMLVAFLPFPTKLVAEAIDRTSAERAAVIFYGLSLLLVSTAVAALWRYLATHRDLLRDDVSDEEVTAIRNRTAPNVGFYLLAIALAFLAPQVAAFGYLALAFVYIFRTRGDRSARGQRRQGRAGRS